MFIVLCKLPQVKDLALLKQALVVDSVLRHVQWDHCNPFPSPMSEDAAKRLPQLLDFPGMLVLANKTQDQVVLAEHVHQDIADDAPVSHKYMCVFTSADRAQDFINASGIGPMCSLVPCDGRVVFGTLRDVRHTSSAVWGGCACGAGAEGVLRRVPPSHHHHLMRCLWSVIIHICLSLRYLTGSDVVVAVVVVTVVAPPSPRVYLLLFPCCRRRTRKVFSSTPPAPLTWKTHPVRLPWEAPRPRPW